ncbi:MAG TPA: dihydrofolate reductase family protein [Kofleriaceae bacterium]|nr:dihydrofolate reductase family protein [Kofleriaceae bacterium]
MSRVRVNCFSMSFDGFAAGPDQTLDAPFGGRAGRDVAGWFTATRTFRTMIGADGGTEGPDDELAEHAMDDLGAWILGRNMFGPIRGPWPDDSWRGWWGDDPPYHCPVFVLTHHARAPITMEGGTVFHFVTGGIHEALARAKEAAGARDVRIGGGAATIRQYLEAKLIDTMHLAISPVVMGAGEPLLAGLDLHALGYGVTSHTTTPAAMHVMLARQ